MVYAGEHNSYMSSTLYEDSTMVESLYCTLSADPLYGEQWLNHWTVHEFYIILRLNNGIVRGNQSHVGLYT